MVEASYIYGIDHTYNIDCITGDKCPDFLSVQELLATPSCKVIIPGY